MGPSTETGDATQDAVYIPLAPLPRAGPESSTDSHIRIGHWTLQWRREQSAAHAHKYAEVRAMALWVFGDVF